MAQTTDFGKRVKIRLIEKDITTAQLAEKVSEKTGLFCDVKYLSRIFTGFRNAPKIRAAICEILDIKEE